MKKYFVMMLMLCVSSIAIGQTLSNPLPTPTVKKDQCTALTQKGTRCSRSVEKGKQVCSQHAKATARTYYIGSNGGVYYVSAKGNKVYVKK